MMQNKVLSVSVLVAVLAQAGLSRAEGKDAEATKLAEQAIQDDYLAARFDPAIKKLKKALALCRKSSCSSAVLARVHRDLGTVYFVGKNRQGPGKEELKKALAADPAVELDETLATPELKAAFAELGGGSAGADNEEEQGAISVDLDEEPAEAEAPAEEAPPSSNVPRNWAGAGLLQDFLFHSSVQDVCATQAPDGNVYGSPSYRCFAGDAFVQDFVYSEAGNEMSGGIGVATTRLLLSYDRLFGDRYLIGARLGFAFGGGPTAPDQSDFMPFHAEARAAIFLGREPLSGGLSPYVAASLGFAQVMAKVPVEVFIDEAGYANRELFSVDAWRKAGNAFAALGLGVAAPVGPLLVNGELRAMQLFGTSATGLSLGLGAAYGF